MAHSKKIFFLLLKSTLKGAAFGGSIGAISGVCAQTILTPFGIIVTGASTADKTSTANKTSNVYENVDKSVDTLSDIITLPVCFTLYGLSCGAFIGFGMKGWPIAFRALKKLA